MIGILGFDSRWGLGIFLFTRTSLGPNPASYPMGNRGSFPGGNAAGREADQSSPSSAEVKNAWSYTSSPHYASMAWCLIKRSDNFTFT